MQVTFVGAGPGDPDLITVKGSKAIAAADVVIYAGSLVNPEILNYAKAGAEIYNSAGMTLEEVLAVMRQAASKGLRVARVHTGDPSIYGAIQEQMDVLAAEGITYEVIPGVSSFLAAAATLKQEFTLPEVTQTVIVTRMAGRTDVPPEEDLAALAKHRAAMCIFLSVGMIEEVVEKLLAGYTSETPVTVIQKATWPDQKIVEGSLQDIAAKVKEAGITKTAMIMVGDFLDSPYAKSKLYDAAFTHEYRTADK